MTVGLEVIKIVFSGNITYNFILKDLNLDSFEENYKIPELTLEQSKKYD
jgi:hypothetical protein